MLEYNWKEDLKKAIDAPPNLQSIFTKVDIGQGTTGINRGLLRPQRLGGHQDEGIEGLRLSLGEDLKKLADWGLDQDETTLYFLQQIYGWRVAPTDVQVSGVSWFDDRRIRIATKASGDSYILLKGDLSGIQEYIYENIKQNTAGGLSKLAKRLRGRSTIVSLLTDFLANIVLKELGLSNWNLLFAGGGHFNLLIPDTQEMQNKLAFVFSALDQELIRNFGNSLQLVVAQIKCGEDIKTNAGRYFELLDAEKNHQKYQTHKSSLSSRFYATNTSEISEEKRTNRDLRMEGFGKEFPLCEYLVETYSKQPIQGKGHGHKALGCQIGDHYYGLFACRTLDSVEDLMLSQGEFIVHTDILRINSTEGFIPDQPIAAFDPKKTSFGFRFLGKNVPMKEGGNGPQSFEEIAQAEGDQIEMINAMRLDVDDLGGIFSKGLGDKASLAEIAALSREMHYFFSMVFDNLAREYDMYVIYAGGDDAFVVGKWDKTIAFAEALHREFKAFTRANPNLHFSAGIFMGKPHYPVGRFYRDAGRLQDEAKDANYHKNQVKVFNHALHWESFAGKIVLGNDIAELLKKTEGKDQKKFTMSFAFRLLQLVKTSFYDHNGMNDGVPFKQGGLNAQKFSRNIANFRYLLARNNFSKAEIEKAEESLQKRLINDFLKAFSFGSSALQVRDYLVALNFALFSIRSKKNN